MPHQAFKLVFGAVGSEVGDLRFEGHYRVGRSVDNGGAKIENLAGVAFERAREFTGVWVQAHAQHGIIVHCGGAELG